MNSKWRNLRGGGAASLCSLLAILSAACDGLPPAYQRSSGTLAADMPPAERVAAAQARSARGNAFLDAVRPYLASPLDGDVVIKWNDTENVRHLYGPGFAVNLTTFGCSTGGAEAARCFLESNRSVFGEHLDADRLRLVRRVPLENGSEVYRFRQYEGDVPVAGADAIVTLNADGHLTSVYSRFVDGLVVPLDGYPSVAERIAQADRTVAFAEVLALPEASSVVEEMPLVIPDPSAAPPTGVAALQLLVETEAGELRDIVVAVGDGRILRNEPRAVATDQILRTAVAYEAFSLSTCPYGTCKATGYSCSGDFTPDDLCVEKCTSHADCNAAYANWRCWTADPVFPGYCHTDRVGADLTLYNGSYWVQSAYGYHALYSEVKRMTDEADEFFCGGNPLTRNGWNGSGGAFNSYLRDHNGTAGTDSAFGTNRPAGAWATGTSVEYFDWHTFDTAGDANWAARLHLVGEEWGHNVQYSEAGGWLSGDECLVESVGAMFARLMIVKEWNGDHTFAGGTCPDTAWDDDRSGIQGGCTRLPYAHRSRFDMWHCTNPGWPEGAACGTPRDCLPYQNCDPSNNQCVNWGTGYSANVIWQRFLRLLADGTDALSADGNGEDVGLASLTGVGWTTTAYIVHHAVASAQTSTTLEDWVDLLLAAGSTYGVWSDVRAALNATGFVGPIFTPFTATSDRTPVRYTFDAWTRSSTKSFWAWKESGTSDVKVRFYDGTTPTTVTIAANTDATPTVAEYRDRLYVFYRDRTSSDVRYRYFRHDSTTLYGPYNIGTLGIRASGAVDATFYSDPLTANADRLYLFFVDSTSGHMTMAWCESTSYCSTTSWHDFGSGIYKRDLGYSARPGHAAVAGAKLNGTWTDLVFLYVVSAEPVQGTNYGTIRVDQVTPTGSIYHTEYVPTHYRSYRTYGEIGAKIMNSAFPDGADERNYLYVAWVDAYEYPTIYKAVVQSWDDYPPYDSSWITLTDDTFLNSLSGVRIDKGMNPDVASTIYTFVDEGGAWRYANLQGRY